MNNYSYSSRWHTFSSRWQYFIAKLRGLKKSLTAWFNAVFASVVIALPMLQDTFSQLQAYLPENIYRVMIIIVIIGNFMIRFKTTSDLADK